MTHRLYTTLASHLSHPVLRTLEIGFPEDYEKEMPMPSGNTLANYVISGRILAKLFRFTNLTEVTLASPVGFDIDDRTVEDMARAWPKLKSLRLTACID